MVSVYKTEKITMPANDLTNDLDAIPNPTRAGYNFTGWYTKDGKSLNVNNITEGHHEGHHPLCPLGVRPNAPICHPLTVTGGTVTVK